MNGRAYDYNLGRFLSVDPFVQSPGNSQSMNPYSYIMNNPLAGTDPSGYCSKDIGSNICSNGPSDISDMDVNSIESVTHYKDGRVVIEQDNGKLTEVHSAGTVSGGKFSGKVFGKDIDEIGSRENTSNEIDSSEASSSNQVERKSGEFSYNFSNPELGKTDWLGRYNKASIQAIRESISGAEGKLEAALEALENGDYSYVISTYGPKNPEDLPKSVALLKERIKKDIEIVSKLSVSNFSNSSNIEDLSDQFHAEVTPSDCCGITLGLLYWREGANERISTIVHEVSHFQIPDRVRTRDTPNALPEVDYSSDPRHRFNSAYRYEEYIMKHGVK